jgi:glutathione-regulated potassium-efflux system protein KefB
MPHEGNLLQAAVVFLLAAVLTVPLAKRLQLGAVLGYLFAGVIIGPSVLGLIGNPQSVSISRNWAWCCCCSSSAWNCRHDACG